MTPPLTDPAVVDDLGTDLRAAGFDATGVPELLGSSAHRALGRGEFVPALLATEDGAPLSTLIRLFLLGTTESSAAVRAALPATGIERAVANGALELVGEDVRAGLDIRPHADDESEFLVVSDLDSDTRPGPVHAEHVLGIGAASITLANAVIREQVGTALDIGVGCGIQSVHLASHAGYITATDVSTRALALAGATARLNGQTWDLRQGSLFSPVAGERFDLIVSNPPFVIGTGRKQYTYRDSGVAGDGICEQLIRGLPDHLNEGGTAQLLANWIVREDTDWRDRVGSWVAATGLDGWVVQRELADPAEYVALWLKDAGETGGQAEATARAWLEWFRAEKVAGIGMGVLTLRRTDSDDPDVVLDEITGAGEEVTGPEAAAFLARRDWLRDVSDAELLATPLSLASTVILEDRSIATDNGWSTVLRMLRRPGGPGATLQVDDWGRTLLAGCQGKVPTAVLVELLAGVHGVEPDALAAAVLPALRVGVTRGLLHPVETDD
ncbi:methyltransferase [Nakamurella sp. YIM 132087]|uniref:Methyltransferase n=1 Tax=Nakamurella alba TaxID=2665158 RepID=A0A7K1FUH7_9ACTN|nr:class I SAM-dependent methyltransferase [Nakamurella alba]MTD16484.1 methyltransferase [Nakamurella alba]